MPPAMPPQTTASLGVPSQKESTPEDTTSIAAQQAAMMELEQMKPVEAEVKLPLHEDIMQLAMLGEIGPVQTLIDEGRYSATYKDREGITPLHVSYSFLMSCWASSEKYT